MGSYLPLNQIEPCVPPIYKAYYILCLDVGSCLPLDQIGLKSNIGAQIEQKSVEGLYWACVTTKTNKNEEIYE